MLIGCLPEFIKDLAFIWVLDVMERHWEETRRTATQKQMYRNKDSQHYVGYVSYVSNSCVSNNQMFHLQRLCKQPDFPYRQAAN